MSRPKIDRRALQAELAAKLREREAWAELLALHPEAAEELES